jgi:hypothetical protein
MGWPTIFAQLAGGNQPLAIFDTMFNQVAQMLAIPCVASGQNSITVSPIGTAPILPNYAEFCAVRFKAVQTSNAAVSLNFLTLPNLPVYLSDGTTQAGANNLVINQEYVCVFSQALNSGSGGWFLEAASVPAAAPSAGGSVAGLTIVNGGTPNTQLTVTMSEVTLNNAGGQSLRFAAPASFTIDFTLSGVINGLDTGAINSNQNYYLYAISNGANVRGLASLQSVFSSVTPPAGYVFSKLLGAWRTATATAQLMGGQQNGSRFQYRPGIAQGVPVPLITGASGSPTTPTLTSVATTGAVPPIVRSTNLILALGTASGIVSAVAAPTQTGWGALGTAPHFPMAVSSSQTAGAGIGATASINIQGSFVGAGPFFYASSATSALSVDGWDMNI